MPLKSPVHLNSNIFAAVAVKTTGPYVGVHDLVHVCVLPLDSKLDPLRPLKPYLLNLQPCRPFDSDCTISKNDYNKAMVEGINREKANIVLEMWFKQFMEGVQKRLVPVGANWFKIGGFIQEWISPYMYDLIFSPDYRDICTAAAYTCDRADVMAESIPFPKLHMSYVCTTLKVERINSQDVLTEAVAIADAYKRMLRMVKV